MSTKEWMKTAIKEVTEMNISEADSLTFKAAIIMLFINERSANPYIIQKNTGYNQHEIDTVIKNLRTNNILEGKRIVHNWFQENGQMEFILMAMCGSGDIRRHEVDNWRSIETTEQPTEAADDILQEIEQNEKQRNNKPYEFQKDFKD